VAKAWRKPPPDLSLDEKRRRAERLPPEPDPEFDELNEGERQKVQRAVRDLRGD